MRHASRSRNRPVYLLMALTAVVGAATVGIVLAVSDGSAPGSGYAKDAASGAAAASPTTGPAPTTPAPTTPTAAPTAPPGSAGSVVGADTGGTRPAAVVRVATRGTGRLLAATLTGDVEVPGPGDPDGVGVAAVRVGTDGRVCLEAVVTGVGPITAVHIHRGARGVAGPVVAEFPAGAGSSTAGCTTVDRALAGRIRANPENWYVNVHTAAFGKGAVRGQLMW